MGVADTGVPRPESEQPHARRRLCRDPRYVILGILIVGIVALAAVKHKELARLWHELKAISVTTALLALACQLGKYAAVAMTFHLLLRVLDYRVPLPYLFTSGLAMTALNQILPSMGTSGNAYMFAALQRRGVSSGSAIIVTILNLLTYYIAFFLLAFGAMAFLALGHQLHTGEVVVLFVFLAMMLSLFIWIRFRTRTRERLRRTIRDINSLVARVIRNHQAEAIPDHFVDDFFEGRALIVNARKRFILPVLTNLGVFGADTATLLVVFSGIHHPMLYRYVVAGYVVGIILYAFAIVPGALGFYELGMTGMFIAFGTSSRIALAGTLLFRGFSFWLPIPIGFIVYQLVMHRRRRIPAPGPTAEPTPECTGHGQSDA
jgi:uncharacterized protein (TIRG00374 family)